MLARNDVVQFPGGEKVPVLLFPELMKKARDLATIHGKDSAVVLSCASAEDAYRAALKKKAAGWTMEAVNAPNMEEFSGPRETRYRILMLNRSDVIQAEFTVKS